MLDLTPHLRVGGQVGEGFHWGAEGRARLPGASVGESVGPEPEIDARALFAYSGVPTWVFALHAGYKLGLGGDVLTDSESMRAGDRVALGLSEFDALLLGLGVVKAVGKTEILAEITSEMLLGSGAPNFLESPLRAAGGVRHQVANSLWLNGLVEATIGARPDSLPGDPLAPVEPRVLGLIGVTWRFLAPRAPIAPPGEQEPAPSVTQKKDPEEPVKEGPPPAVFSEIQVTVVDSKGHPISDANVTIELPGSEAQDGGSRSVPLVDRNVYVIGEVPLGEVEVTVSADLLKSQTQTISIKSSDKVALEFKLEKAADVGSQLRGLVRAYSGEGLAASVRVEPGDLTAVCNAQGSFELDLPPGVYKVIIEAEGYRAQRRALRVRKEGVTVLNADLQKNTD